VSGLQARFHSETGTRFKAQIIAKINIPPVTKKVPAKEDGTGGTFTVSSTLDSK
jgi:hypothetical protein